MKMFLSLIIIYFSSGFKEHGNLVVLRQSKHSDTRGVYTGKR